MSPPAFDAWNQEELADAPASRVVESSPASGVSAEGDTRAHDIAPRRLSAVVADLNALHATCLTFGKFGGGPKCDSSHWWDITVRLYDIDSVDHLREHYAAVSRCWRGYLDGGVAASFDRELAIELMKRSRTWGR